MAESRRFRRSGVLRSGYEEAIFEKIVCEGRGYSQCCSYSWRRAWPNAYANAPGCNERLDVAKGAPPLHLPNISQYCTLDAQELMFEGGPPRKMFEISRVPNVEVGADWD